MQSAIAVAEEDVVAAHAATEIRDNPPLADSYAESGKEGTDDEAHTAEGGAASRISIDDAAMPLKGVDDTLSAAQHEGTEIQVASDDGDEQIESADDSGALMENWRYRGRRQAVLNRPGKVGRCT